MTPNSTMHADQESDVVRNAVLFFQLATMLLISVFVAVLFLNRSVLLRRGLARIIFWQAIAE